MVEVSIAVVAHTLKQGLEDGVTTDAIDTTDANLLVIGVGHYATSPLTISDSEGNAWTALTDRTGGAAAAGARLYYCANPTVGPDHTVTVLVVNGYTPIGFVALSGAHSSPFDQEVGQAISTGPTTSYTPGSLTPSQDGCALIVMYGTNPGTAGNVGSSFTRLAVDAASGASVQGILAYKIQTTAGAENPVATWTTNATRAAAMASFKPAATTARLNFTNNAILAGAR